MTKETIICCQELTPHLLSQKFGIDMLDTNKDGIEIKISVILNKLRCKLAVAGELFLHFQRLMESFSVPTAKIRNWFALSLVAKLDATR